MATPEIVILVVVVVVVPVLNDVFVAMVEASFAPADMVVTTGGVAPPPSSDTPRAVLPFGTLPKLLAMGLRAMSRYSMPHAKRLRSTNGAEKESVSRCPAGDAASKEADDDADDSAAAPLAEDGLEPTV